MAYHLYTTLCFGGFLGIPPLAPAMTDMEDTPLSQELLAPPGSTKIPGFSDGEKQGQKKTRKKA